MSVTTHLKVHSPSSTTVEYVVSSKKHSGSRTASIVRQSARVVAFAQLVLLDLTKAQVSGVLNEINEVDVILRLSFLERLFRPIAIKTDWLVLAIVNLFVLFVCLRRFYIEESLLVLQGLGIQTSTSSPYYFMSPTTTFIPTTKIQDIVIHEAFKGLEVRFYLAVIVESATEVVVVFPTLLPRLNVLQQVWRGARGCLYANGGKPV